MCPDRKLLEQLTLGLLSHDHFAPLEEHLATCQRCLRTLQEMEPSDALIEALREAHRAAERRAGLAEESGPAQPAGFALSPGSFHRLSAEADPHTCAQEGEARQEQRCPPDVDDTSSSAIGAFSTATPLPDPDADPDDGCDERHDFLAPAQSPGELGRLGDYRVLRVLGRGGMGVVFEAEDVRLKRHVALKAMLPDFAFRVSARKRFLREAQAAAAVEHDHIVSIYQVGEECGVPFLAMPLLRGETLADRLASGQYADDQTNAPLASGDAATTPAPLTVQETLRIGREIALGLAAAHGRGLIHRDIKPSNVWLEEETGRAKILDFGLARSATGGEQLTQAGTTVGTPAYMSPEQASGQELDERSDLFSLGCVLYHMATGRRPFLGRDFLSTMLAVTTTEPPLPRALNPELPGGLNDLIVALLSKELSGRPQSAREVAERLSSVANDQAQRVGIPLANRGSAGTRASSLRPTKPPYWRVALVCAATAIVAGVVIAIKNREGRIVATVQTENRADIKLDPEYTAGVKPSAPDDERISKHRSAAPAEKVANIPAPAGRPTPRAFLIRPAAPPMAWPADAPRPAIAPFDEDQAKKHQQEWADYLKLPLERTNSIGMKLVLIPPGEFMMGGTPEEIEQTLDLVGEDDYWRLRIRSEAPRHRVVLTRPFYLAVHEVTEKEYEAVMGTVLVDFDTIATAARKRAQEAGGDTANHPVANASWNDAAQFCAKLSRKEKLQPFYFRADERVLGLHGTGYSLPTEAEWEFACRAGTTTKFWIGDENQALMNAGWIGANSGYLKHEVEELLPNPFGLFDMHGNLWEWVEDAWQPAFYRQFAEKPAVDPRCPIGAGPERVMRGGLFDFGAFACRSSSRNTSGPTNRSYGIGFRVALAAVNRDPKRRPAEPSAASILAPTGKLAPPARLVQPAAPEAAWPSDAPPPAIAPFDEEQAQKHQQAWADYLKLPLEHTNSIGMKLVLIPPGEFMMGGRP
jgi:eukaryotic-like serine/threonine-protein kinase